ncbi:MAG: AAA family ATPase [Candidatus Nanoarchaeia archaeon]|jgi:nicotinamide riboside kinase|nr:AAA family ATPase [Candidatus Nanoarchaeia archaeon]
MKIIGISGIPGSGKTTLARALASACCNKFKNIELISEYARQYIIQNKSIDSIWEQLTITDKQIEWENSVSESTEVLITDSPIYLGFLYAIDLVKFNNVKDIIAYNRLFEKLIKLNNRYDLIFHLESVISLVNDGVRCDQHLNDKWRTESSFILMSLFKIFNQKNIIVLKSDNLEERTRFCLEFMKDNL